MDHSLFQQIDFCNGVAWIPHTSFKYKILNSMKSILNSEKFNFDEYKILKSSTKTIKENEYFISLRTNGSSFLFFCIFIDNFPYSVLINIKTLYEPEPDILILKFRFNSKIYNGSIFEGELSFIDNCWIFFITDCLFMCNISLLHYDLLTRTEEYIPLLLSNTEWYIEDSNFNCCKLEFKEHFTIRL